MKDAKEFKQSQLPKQEEAIFAAIAVAENSPNPVIELPFFIYSEMEEKLKAANWKVLGTCQCVHDGKFSMFTHLCPMDVEERNEKKNETKDTNVSSAFYAPGNL